MTKRQRIEKFLIGNNYVCYSPGFWEKHWDGGRREQRVRIKQKTVIITDIEHPIFTEGWSEETKSFDDFLEEYKI